MRVASVLGRPVEIALNTMPTRYQKLIHDASQAALKRGLIVVTTTLTQDSRRAVVNFSSAKKVTRRRGRWHALASFGVGAAGGLFGALSLPMELPITTAIILRSIAATAQEFGLDLADPQTQLECLYVLGMGAKEGSNGYWTSRVAFAQLAREAAAFITNRTAQEILREMESHTAPLLIKFMSTVAARFEVVVSEKLLAEALPVVGALGGGVINAAFTQYFSDAAHFHFGLRAIEGRYGREAIENYYHSEERAV